MAHWRLFTNKDFQYSRITQLLDDSATEQDGGETGPRVLADRQEIRTAVRQVEYRVAKDGKRTRFEHGGKTGLASKIPRAHVWRTYRLSLGESLLGVLSIKASEAFNLVELDVFLATEFPQLGSLEIARQMVLFLFADAVRCGTSLAIRTTKYCCGGRIPACIQELAAGNGVKLAHADAGAISPEEGKELFLKLSRFPPSVEKRIRDIDSQGLLSSVRICYLMAKQIWTRQEIECVLTHAPYPELVLGNKTGPNHGLLYSQALFDARCGILADRLHKVASRREAPTNPQQNRYVENGGEERSVAMMCGTDIPHPLSDPTNMIAFHQRTEPLIFSGWGPLSETVTIPPDRTLIAYLCPYDLDMLLARLLTDWKKIQSQVLPNCVVCLVVPFDFHLLSPKQKHRILEQHSGQTQILVCPDLCGTLTGSVSQKMGRGEFVRT